MLSKDSIPVGLTLGLLLPFIGYALLLELYDQMGHIGMISDDGLSETFRQRTIALLAICFNLIPFTIFNRQRKHDSMRGLIFPTVLYVITWVVYFRESIL